VVVVFRSIVTETAYTTNTKQNLKNIISWEVTICKGAHQPWRQGQTKLLPIHTCTGN